MNCKQFERRIPAFLSNDLDMQQLEEFIEHTQDCPDCKEELTIQFLVSEGMQYLEDGDSFHLGNELTKRIDQANSSIRLYEHLFLVTTWLEIMSICSFGICIWCFFSLMGV